jgi:hypothetical protein
MRTAFASAHAERRPALVATASLQGVPDVAFKGSLMVFDAEHLAFWEYWGGKTARNLDENPLVAVIYSDLVDRRVVWKYYGSAEVLRDGPVREEIMSRTIEAELRRDPERRGAGVLIRVDEVWLSTKLLMQREPAEAPP